MPSICCIHCAGDLSQGTDAYRCKQCGTVFRVLLGIPDLRIAADTWIDFDADSALAEKLAHHYHTDSFQDLVLRVWTDRKNVPRSILERRLHGIYSESKKYSDELSGDGWIGKLPLESPWLELGCGTGGFLAPACSKAEVVGVDVSLAWLVTTKKRLDEAGLTSSLLCACAERLPFHEGSFGGVMAFDVLEHVSKMEPVIEEIARVTKKDGLLVATTPNRFSVSSEPHVGLWGVGLLPRRAMTGYVRWRNGMDYSHTHPQSLLDLHKSLRARFRVVVETPELWEGEVKQFRPLKRRAAKIYGWLVGWRLARMLLLPIAPFFRVVASRR